MGGFSKNKCQVLVVHCVDTEGPIGGNVRRRSDGSKEFMKNSDKEALIIGMRLCSMKVSRDG